MFWSQIRVEQNYFGCLERVSRREWTWLPKFFVFACLRLRLRNLLQAQRRPPANKIIQNEELKEGRAWDVKLLNLRKANNSIKRPRRYQDRIFNPQGFYFLLVETLKIWKQKSLTIFFNLVCKFFYKIYFSQNKYS